MLANQAPELTKKIPSGKDVKFWPVGAVKVRMEWEWLVEYSHGVGEVKEMVGVKEIGK